MTLAWAVPMGLLVGLALGALGGGGAILAIPALVYLMGQPPATASMGALIIVTVSALTGIVPHARAGRVHVVEGVIFGVIGVAGSVAGSHAAAAVSGPWLLTLFAALLLVVAALMWRRASSAADPAASDPELAGASRPADRPGGIGALGLQPAAYLRLLGTATGVGLLTGFFGVGGGFAVVPALVLALGLPMRDAVGTSLLVITINSITALGSRLSLGIQLDWVVIGLFAAFAMLGSLAGARVARSVDPRVLSRAFVALLVGVALYTAAANVPKLLG